MESLPLAAFTTFSPPFTVPTVLAAAFNFVDDALVAAPTAPAVFVAVAAAAEVPVIKDLNHVVLP